MVFVTISYPILIFAPGKWLSKSIPMVSPGVLVRSSIGSFNVFNMAPLSFARNFLSLVGSGTLFMDSRKLFQLLWHALLPSCPNVELPWAGTFWCRAVLSFLLVFSRACLAHWSTTCFYPEFSSAAAWGERVPNGGVQYCCHHFQVILVFCSEIIIIQFVFLCAPEFIPVCVSGISYYSWNFLGEYRFGKVCICGPTWMTIKYPQAPDQPLQPKIAYREVLDLLFYTCKERGRFFSIRD